MKNDIIQQGGEKHTYYKTSINDSTLYATVGCSGRTLEGGNMNDVNRKDRDKIVAWMFSNESSVPNVINKGGSLDLRIFNTKLEGRFIDEDGMVRDSFFIVKTSKTFSQINLTKGQSTYLTAAWAGKYKWSHDGNITEKSAVVTPTQNTTYTITDPATGFSQSYTVTVNSTKTAHSLVPFGNYGWWSGVISPRGAPTDSQWANFDFDQMYSNAKLIWPLYGQGNTDEKGRISLGAVEAGTRLMFKNYFYINSGPNYSEVVLSIFHEPRQAIRIYINGIPYAGASTGSYTIANRKLTMYAMPGYYFPPGKQISITIGMPIPSSSLSPYPYSLTFDAELVGIADGVVPPPASQSFRVTTTNAEPVCENSVEADVSFTTTNSPSNVINYVAMLSNGQTNEIVGANTKSPIRIKLPADYDKSADVYTVQVLPRQVAANLNGSQMLQNLRLPTARLSGGRAIRYEETDTLTLNFTGTPPFAYNVTNLGSGQTNEKSLKLLVNPVTNTEYTLQSVENTCGVGTSEGKATITVLKPMLSFEKLAADQTLCNGFRRNMVINAVNPPLKEHEYQVYLGNGSVNPILVGTGKTSPVGITIPDTISERNNYYFTARYSDIPGQYYTSESLQNVVINKTAKGSLTSSSGDSIGVLTGEKVQLTLNLEGTFPYRYVIKYGSQDTLSGITSLKQITRAVSIPTSNTFELQSVDNIC
ncbi:MAG: hypothetical protein KKG00_05970, partial [Bacteroidetes bacterium]|nr:hypothetical protein [Bacteroidota bacterium]